MMKSVAKLFKNIKNVLKKQKVKRIILVIIDIIFYIIAGVLFGEKYIACAI